MDENKRNNKDAEHGEVERPPSKFWRGSRVLAQVMAAAIAFFILGVVFGYVYGRVVFTRELDNQRVRANAAVIDRDALRKQVADLEAARTALVDVFDKIARGTGVPWVKASESAGQYADKLVQAAAVVPRVEVWGLTFVNMTNGSGGIRLACPSDRPSLWVQPFEVDGGGYYEGSCISQLPPFQQ